MSRKYRAPLIVLLSAAGLMFLGMFLYGSDIAVLNPEGSIASQQRDLIVKATLLMLLVVIPVFIMTFAIVWRYREGNKKARYTPDWDHHLAAELSWWAIPGIIILVLGMMIWKSSHQLDPYRPLDSTTKPITVQVVALQWKWLFIYPEQDIATVNFFQFPEDTPINFVITADAPMNSFWIPKLGGQVYAMAGMTTKLHLMADGPGSYRGLSANISGEGFSDMTFTAKSSTRSEFEDWVQAIKSSSEKLGMSEYAKLAEPGKGDFGLVYSSTEEGLHSKVVAKYMRPVAEQGGEDSDNEPDNTGHHH